MRARKWVGKSWYFGFSHFRREFSSGYFICIRAGLKGHCPLVQTVCCRPLLHRSFVSCTRRICNTDLVVKEAVRRPSLCGRSRSRSVAIAIFARSRLALKEVDEKAADKAKGEERRAYASRHSFFGPMSVSLLPQPVLLSFPFISACLLVRK